jgi:FkbM family methyltransferase
MKGQMYELTEGTFHTPGGHPVRMTYRLDTNDADTLRASLDEDEYGLPQGLTGTALDVGGYLGSVGIALALDNPELAVTIIEPVPENADLIERNLEANGVEAYLIRNAVGKGRMEVRYGFGGSHVLEHHAFVGNSSLADGIEAPHQSIIYYDPAKLADFVPLTYLKIDCEGGEFTFLDSPTFNRYVQTIVGESHAVNGHKGSDIVALLEATHEVTLIGDGEGTCGFRAVRRA